MRVITLYHGTTMESALDILHEGINIYKGKRRTDFGQGFYLTTSLQTAKTWAAYKANISTPAVIAVKYNLQEACENSKIMLFHSPDLKWAQFVVNNRLGKQYVSLFPDQNLVINLHTYDICIGCIADGHMYEIVKNIECHRRLVNYEDQKKMLSSELGEQISLHSEKAVSYVDNITLIQDRRLL